MNMPYCFTKSSLYFLEKKYGNNRISGLENVWFITIYIPDHSLTSYFYVLFVQLSSKTLVENLFLINSISYKIISNTDKSKFYTEKEHMLTKIINKRIFDLEARYTEIDLTSNKRKFK